MSRGSRPSRPDIGSQDAILFSTPHEKAALEARNSLLQFDEVCRLVEHHPNPDPESLGLTTSLICALHTFAIRDIYACAGRLRDCPIYIQNSPHTCPPHESVPGLLAEMCETANTGIDWPPIRTAAYLMWRLNWIHAFAGGNGRTSRAVSYYALCVRLGGLLIPGPETIPEQISNYRQPYYEALMAADASVGTGLDLSGMESLLTNMLARQLMSLPPEHQNPEFLYAILDAARTPPSTW